MKINIVVINLKLQVLALTKAILFENFRRILGDLGIFTKILGYSRIFRRQQQILGVSRNFRRRGNPVIYKIQEKRRMKNVI